MSLDFAQLTKDVVEMAHAAGERFAARDHYLSDIEVVCRDCGGDREAIDRYVQHIRDVIFPQNQIRFRGGAFPLFPGDHIGSTVSCRTEDIPAQATILAIDGSQIVPDRHAAYVYYLINIGAIIFHHGQAEPPVEFRRPDLRFPRPDEFDNFRFGDNASVSVERDLSEVHTLAELTRIHHHHNRPTLAVMDQRLLYVPIGDLGPGFKRQTMERWQEGLNKIRDAGGWVVGFVDRPGKSAVIATLRSFVDGFNPQAPDDLGHWDGLVDAELFSRLLAPGDRSAVFVDLSPTNHRFARPGRPNEMCFFYLNTGRENAANIARVDLPRWVAEDKESVRKIHALLLDQCRIVGQYPYVLARADEIAVVSRQDQADLEFRIARQLQERDLSFSETAKQQMKGIVRGGKIRHHT